MNVWLLQHLPFIVFSFLLGACVGSFINVVNFRLPARMSVISPPSRCPVCGARLRFFTENLPILGWIVLRGRCKHCGVKISPEYMIIETIMALVFAGIYLAYFASPSTMAWWSDVGGKWWVVNGGWRVWPAFIAHLFLIAALISMTIIDLRHFIIPIQIPNFVAVTALIAYPLTAALPHFAPLSMTWPIQCVGWQATAVVIGGVLGLALSVILLWTGRIRYSFADYDDFVEEGETLAEYPHARREMIREIMFLVPCLIGMTLGWFIGAGLPAAGPPHLVQAIIAPVLGYMVGAGIVWGVRILGSLAFGREAMGMGDVHMMGAVGAVLGWWDPIIVFFVLAPVSGLLWALLSMCLSSVFKTVNRHLPYGPHLALATVVVILCRPGLEAIWTGQFGAALPWPLPGFVP